MALNNGSLKAQVAAQKSEEAENNKLQSSADKQVPETPYVLLELKLYKRYFRQTVPGKGTMYEKGTATEPIVYKFTREQATILLMENDGGRAIWKKYRPVVARPKPQPEKPKELGANVKFKDMTAATITEATYETVEPTITRLDLGSDEDIADVLESINNQNQGSEDDELIDV